MGSLFSLNLNFNFKTKNKKKNFEKLFQTGKTLKISILPISSDFTIENLYPITNQVHRWSSFVVGCDKTYILSNVGDLNLKQFFDENVLNNKGIKLPDEIFNFLDHIWSITLKGEDVQIYMVFSGSIYLLNSYAIKNKNNKIIGAIAFIRSFEDLPSEGK